MINKNYKTYFTSNEVIKLYIISLIFFLIRWGTSFYFINEELIVKILFESISDGSFYYPLIKFLSNAEFTNSLNPFIEEIQATAIPFGSLIIHTFFYKIFGLYGFIFVDILGIFLLLLIFYQIFLFFCTKQNSLFFSLLLFGIPLILKVYFANFNDLPFLQYKDFFTLRVHRPFPSSLYFFSFILLILFMHHNNFFQKKYFAFVGILLGLSLSSFYYFFITEVLILFFYIIFVYKKKTINLLFKNYISILISLITFLLISLPFILNMKLAEEDVLTSAGVFQLTNEKRFYLANHYFVKLFNIKFIIFNIIIFYIIFKINRAKIISYKIINIFFLIYISSLIGPFLLIFFSTKVSHMYHFNNNIVIYGILLLFVSMIVILQSKITLKLNFIYLLLFLVITNVVQVLNNNSEIDQNRIEFNKIVKIIKSKNFENNENSLLTFDSRFMKWGMLDDRIRYLNLTMVGSTGKNYDLIENDLINSFKFLDLDSSDFMSFLENKKKDYRYVNQYVLIFFRHRYTANSLFTYNDSKNFDSKIKDFILNTSPLYVQQVALPLEEFTRLENKFKKNKIEKFLTPKVIILNNDLPFIKKIKLNTNVFCNAFKGKKYTLFMYKKENIKCQDLKSGTK